jgi:hypothetical protein
MMLANSTKKKRTQKNKKQNMNQTRKEEDKP